MKHLPNKLPFILKKLNYLNNLRMIRHLNQDILNTVQEGIQLIDKDRKIIQVNKQLCEIFKWNDSAEEMIGTFMG